MKIGEEVFIHGYVDEIRKDCIIIRNLGGFFGTVKDEVRDGFDAVEVVRCKDCRWYDPPHIEYNNGKRKDVDETGPWVMADIGTNVGGRCRTIKTYCLSHDRENPDDNEKIVCFRRTTDYCSYGERKEE